MWVFNGKVNIIRRESQGSSKGADKDAARLWGSTDRLFAPAWTMPIRQAREIGSQFVVHKPSLAAMTPGEGMLMQEATITPDDGLKLLDFIVLSLEADRKDWLEDFQFDIQTTGYELWAIPARDQRSRWEFLVNK